MNHPNVAHLMSSRMGDAGPKARRAITMLRNAVYEAPHPPACLVSQVDALYYLFHTKCPPPGLRLVISRDDKK